MRARARLAYAVRSRKALSQMLSDVIQHFGAGNEMAAAATIGISQPTLNRLRNGKRSSMSPRIADLLHKAIIQLPNGAKRQRQFLEVVLNPGAANILQSFVEYQRQRLGVFKRMPRDSWYAEVKPKSLERLHELRNVGMHQSPFSWELDELLWRMRVEMPKEFARFERRQNRRARRTARLRALRLFEPLLEYRPSGFVERGGHELTPAEFKAFVHAGLTRDRILANRAPDPHRSLDVQRRIAAKYEME